ncbi:coiled-coil domain-containing protein [Psychrobacter piscatorii]|uniref:Uncharacterized protein n=1 Tax=Psychrobacter piscatorii TaxID=554343 RepID=A0A0T6DNT0_9GAMM|nr:hypothetical protein [Psychrobacter piscatorii]KRU21610.1 hypothetical protein AS194_11635 [Psychrobacter piscatorii]
MIKYLSIDEAILITENKIRGSMFETLGAKQFLDRFINKGQLKPIYYFDGYAVLKHSAQLDFKGVEIKNIWRIEGYFKDDHSLYLESRKSFSSSIPFRDSAFKGLSNSIFKLRQNAGYVHEIIVSRFIGDDETSKVINNIKPNDEYYNDSHAWLFHEEPSYEHTYEYEDIEESILIDRDNVFFSIEDINNILEQLPVNTGQHTTALNISEQPNQLLTDAQNKIAELEQQLSKFQASVPDVVTIPFGKRIDLTNKKLPPDERLKESYQIYSNDFSFHEDTHPVNTPDEMIKRIQGLLNVIKKKDSKIFELEQQTNTPANAQAEIDKLKEQLDKANTELAAAKTTTTDQTLDWQNMSEHVYPPELHLALMIWQRIYVDNELKDSHITSHGGKFKVIAKKLGLNPDNTLGKRVAMLINTAHSKNKQDELADLLRAIEQLHMPPRKEKTTS